MQMRRKDREVTDIDEKIAIMGACKTCHVAMIDEGMPYIVPLSFGFEMNGNLPVLYFHCAKEGRKIKALKNDNRVCFEMCEEGEPVFAHETPCNSGYYFSSIIGSGHAEFVKDTDEKCHALSLLLKQQADMDVAFTQKQADGVCVFKIVAESFSGKRKVRPSRA